uniref:Uncharacterized protein n=1 Tax=Ralstonia solanacearum TaxID=305 RepID=A0A0S4WX73_RALSL|nr:protein of unknown function [Ralstonia solanacearum]
MSETSYIDTPKYILNRRGILTAGGTYCQTKVK